ncbi:MAG TPA: hypothetical protein VHC63_07575 [Acidimicrobiales bacterium]|nr:hypothetical protein [Acidimicrobiales bacterium]
MRIPLAVAGEAPLAALDEYGYLHFEGGWRVEWWVGGDDQWHVPAASTSRRQRVVDLSPVVETAIRVPGGDVVWRAAAVADAEGGAIALEFHNTATIPVAIGVALVAPDDIAEPRSRPSLHFTAPARAAAADVGVELLVHPVSHTTLWRASIGASPPDNLPPLDAVARGWHVMTRQGASIVTGDATVDDALAVARASLLLHAGGIRALRHRALGAPVATALTLLGHESEAEALRVDARVRPRRRGLPIVTDIAPDLITDPLVLFDDPAAAAATVSAVRSQLVDDTQRRVVTVFPNADPAAWRGRSVDVANLPTNRGPVSFALRWHGDHPALLWEAPPKVSVRAPAFDPDWSSTEPSGEVLLGAPR